MNDGTLLAVRQTAADVFGRRLDAVTARDSRDTIPEWDSIAHVNLVVALEQQFGLQFAPEEMIDMLSIEIIAMLVDEKLAAR